MTTSYAERLRVGISCYPTFGGSGVIATEVGQELARRGHRVHFICYEVPSRLDHFAENVVFHAVQPPEYPLFHHQPYALALTSRMVEVAEYEGLDLLHVHYAVPHATSAYLARQILGEHAPKIVTTLHGTDITLVGNDRSYLPITRFSIEQSDAVTAPSRYLADATHRELGIGDEIDVQVIPNFVDTARFRPDRSGRARCLAQLFCDDPSRGGVLTEDTALVTHVSNFRRVKRVDLVVRAFADVAGRRSARLVLVGDGPERSPTQALVRELGLQDRVRFLGNREDIEPLLQSADLFVQASEAESFGLAALEAQACGVPVVSTDVGGVGEVIADGLTGLLVAPADVDGLATAAAELLADGDRWQRFSSAARARAVEHFELEATVGRYETCYRRVLEGS